MTTTPIYTRRLELVPQTPAAVRAQVEAMDPAAKAELSPDWLARLHASTAADPWTHGFALVQRASGSVIGTCGFTGPPADDGVVEIAYGVAPDHQGQGYATEAAAALASYAFSSGQVRVVRAHTRPEPNASTRVLTKCGFHYVGAVLDPADGLVWRWEKTNARA